MKVEVEISDEDAKFLTEVFLVTVDIPKFLATFIQETCRAIREATAMQKAGIKFSQAEIDQAGIEVGRRTIELSSNAVCVGCGERLRFNLKEGWVHMDGEIYKKGPDGSDDHCALPRREKEC